MASGGSPCWNSRTRWARGRRLPLRQKLLSRLSTKSLSMVAPTFSLSHRVSRSPTENIFPVRLPSLPALRFSSVPLWINGILLARRFLCLFSGLWGREAKPSPDSAFTQGGCFNARSTHYSRYFYPGTHHFGLRFTSVSLFAMDGGGGRNDPWTVHHLLRNAPGARQPETDRKSTR